MSLQRGVDLARHRGHNPAMIYLDYAASSPLRPEVLETLSTSNLMDFANPSAAHKLGKQQKNQIEQIRSSFIKSFLSISPEENDYFVFTSSATEANTTIIQGLPLKSGDEVFYSDGDHPSIVQNILALESKGVAIKICPLDNNGQIDLDWLKENISPNLKLFVLAHVNNHNGTIQPLEKISEILKNKSSKCHFHVDAVQSYGLLPIKVNENRIDSVSIGGHKISAPKGIAGFYLKRDGVISPLLIGGGHQDGYRSSTEVTPLIKAFDKARELAFKDKINVYQDLNLFLRGELLKLNEKIYFPFSAETTSPRILSCVVQGLSSDILMRHLEQENIYISSSSACSSKIKGSNTVFKALHIPEQDHKSVLRISLGWGNSKEQLKQFVAALSEILEDMEFLINNK